MRVKGLGCYSVLNSLQFFHRSPNVDVNIRLNVKSFHTEGSLLIYGLQYNLDFDRCTYLLKIVIAKVMKCFIYFLLQEICSVLRWNVKKILYLKHVLSPERLYLRPSKVCIKNVM